MLRDLVQALRAAEDCRVLCELMLAMLSVRSVMLLWTLGPLSHRTGNSRFFVLVLIMLYSTMHACLQSNPPVTMSI